MGLTKPRAAQIYNLDYKQSVRVVTVVNITLTGGAPAVVDGVNVSQSDRILVTGQTTGSQNGLYQVATVGAGSNGTWTRTNDGNDTGEIESGMIVMVTEGTVYKDTQWKLTTENPITIGTTTLVFDQNYSANSISAGSSNVSVLANANVTISSAGTANVVLVSSTGTVTSGTASVTGNATVGNISATNHTGTTVSVTGTATAASTVGGVITGTSTSVSGTTTAASVVGGVITGTSTSVSGTTTAASVVGGVITGTSTSVSGNVTGGNILTIGILSATGNVTGNFFVGNGSLLTGLSAGTANGIANGATNITIPESSGNIAMSVAGASNTVVINLGSLTMYGAFAGPKILTANITVADSVNGLLLGPITLNNGYNITVPTSSTLYVYAP